jgi:proline iminopeptidase
MKGDRDLLAELYPPIEPYRHGWLAVGGPHQLYWEEAGNPRGVPVIFLHGGPGAGCAPVHRRFFDPHHYRIILFDQRGSGRSTPNADLTDNTTQALVNDLETLRQFFKVERWLVFGGSWGSTLALAYAQAHTHRCLGLVLRGIFLFTAPEVHWFMHEMGRIFPEAERMFRDFIPAAERHDLLGAYSRRLNDPDPKIHLPAAQCWCTYEESCSRLLVEPGEPRMSGAVLAMARIEAHYMIHQGFLEEGQLLRDVHKLHGLPATIVQGRYDIVCPITSADALTRAWPGTAYHIIPDAGHSAMEPGIRAGLVSATNRFRALRTD